MSVFRANYAGKRVLVTGAGKGLGRALSVQLHENGAIVYALSRTQANLDDLVAECPKVIPIVADVSDWDKTRVALNNALTAPVDILINSAGSHSYEPLMAISSHSFDSLMAVNVKAMVNVSQVCGAKMIEAGIAGTIINISSITATRPHANRALYSASKAAISNLTKTMASQLGPHKINVVAIELGYMDTDMSRNVFPSHKAHVAFLESIKSQSPLGEVILPMDQAVNSILFVGSGLVDMMTASALVLDEFYEAY